MTYDWASGVKCSHTWVGTVKNFGLHTDSLTHYQMPRLTVMAMKDRLPKKNDGNQVTLESKSTTKSTINQPSQPSVNMNFF